VGGHHPERDPDGGDQPEGGASRPESPVDGQRGGEVDPVLAKQQGLPASCNMPPCRYRSEGLHARFESIRRSVPRGCRRYGDQ
jgi:hypothetical protein